MQLNGYECGMLDALLEALSAQGCLTAAQLAELFDNDHELALTLIDILATEKFVLEVGYAQGSQIPLLLTLEKKGRGFFENGGFTGCYQSAELKTATRKRAFPRFFELIFARRKLV